MFRRILHMTQNGNGTVLDEAGPDLTNGSTNQIRRRSLSSALPKPARAAALGQFDTFDEIYQSAPASTPEGSYSILKVGEMVRSSHLVGMSMESKRSALMMALEAAGVDVKDLLQDAMLRQRALNDYEETQLKLLREFEAAKTEENRRIQSELEAVTAQYMARIQSNAGRFFSGREGPASNDFVFHCIDHRNFVFILDAAVNPTRWFIHSRELRTATKLDCRDYT